MSRRLHTLMCAVLVLSGAAIAAAVFLGVLPHG